MASLASPPTRPPPPPLASCLPQPVLPGARPLRFSSCPPPPARPLQRRPPAQARHGAENARSVVAVETGKVRTSCCKLLTKLVEGLDGGRRWCTSACPRLPRVAGLAR